MDKLWKPGFGTKIAFARASYSVRAHARNKNRAKNLCTGCPQLMHSLSTTYAQGGLTSNAFGAIYLRVERGVVVVRV